MSETVFVGMGQGYVQSAAKGGWFVSGVVNTPRWFTPARLLVTEVSR